MCRIFKMISWFLVIFLCRFAYALGQNGTDESQESIFDHRSMPVLSEFDDFDICMTKPEAVYCVTDIQLLEDDTPLYQFIKSFHSTSPYKTYQHTKLLRGICGSQRCGLNASHADAGESTTEKLKDCMNTTLHEKYGLQVDTLSVQYCMTQKYSTSPDVLDVVIGTLIILLLLINLGCSLYLAVFPKVDGEDNKLLLAFCIQNNWNVLKEGGKAEGDLIKCFQALRFYSMVAIICAHVLFYFAIGFTTNSEFIEQIYDDFFISMLINVRVILQIFFVMGGFLIANKILRYAETRPLSLKTVFRIVINRWLRYMPVLLVIMGLTMTWVQHMGSGPLWAPLIKRERELSRKNWWQLVIMMPNLFAMEGLCLPQTWYLGADMQLFLITIMVLLVIWRWPRTGTPVLLSVMVISLLVSFLQTYLMNLLPIRLFRRRLADSDTFYYAYISPQSNWAGYHLGVLTAFFYRRAQTEKWNLRNNYLMKLLFYISVPVGMATISMGWDLHHRKASALESAAFNVMNQNFFALNVCIFIIGYIHKCNRIYVSAVEWGPLQPLGTLCYSAMLLHIIILRIYFGNMTRLFYVSIYNMIFVSAGVVTITYLGAVPIYLFVEAPAIQLQKLLFETKPRETETTDKTK